MFLLTELHLTGGAPSFSPTKPQSVSDSPGLADIASNMGPAGMKKQPTRKRFASPQEESVEEAVL